jgi:hypothetical protein
MSTRVGIAHITAPTELGFARMTTAELAGILDG